MYINNVVGRGEWISSYVVCLVFISVGLEHVIVVVVVLIMQ